MKRTDLWLRAVLCLLTLCLLAGVFAACREDDPEKTPSDTLSTGTATQGPNDDDDVPDNLNFNRKFKIYAWDNHLWRLNPAEEETAEDNVKRALYSRNQTIEDRLSIEFDWVTRIGFQSEDKAAFALEIETDCKNDKSFDMVISYNLIPYRLSYKGYLTNLADTKYIDLEKPYWPDEYLNNILYQGKIYGLVDNSSVGSITNLSCIFFNNTLLEAKKIPAPYQFVESNEWTLAKLRELTKDTYQDANNNDKKDEKDVFGIATSTWARVTCWYYAAGLRFSEVQDDGSMVLTGGDTERFSGVISQIGSLFDNNNGLINESTQYTMFEDNRAYFYLSVFTMAKHMVDNDIAINYGVVPNPKLNSEQLRYYTHAPNAHDAYSIPSTAKDVDCSSAVVELFASESYKQVTYVFYEQNLKTRYAPDERLGDMYDLIRESLTFDFVYIHKESSLGADCDNEIRKCIKDTKKDWINAWDGIRGSLEIEFEKLLAAYDALP